MVQRERRRSWSSWRLIPCVLHVRCWSKYSPSYRIWEAGIMASPLSEKIYIFALLKNKAKNFKYRKPCQRRKIIDKIKRVESVQQTLIFLIVIIKFNVKNNVVCNTKLCISFLEVFTLKKCARLVLIRIFSN